MTKIPLSLLLASTVPFVLFSLALSAPMLGLPALIANAKLTEALLVYIAVFTSFLGGLHWGVAIQDVGSRKMAAVLIVGGVAPVAVAWGILFFHDMAIQLLALAMLYAFMWVVDSILYNLEKIPQWFFNLRCIATPIVVVSLYVAYFYLGQH